MSVHKIQPHPKLCFLEIPTFGIGMQIDHFCNKRKRGSKQIIWCILDAFYLQRSSYPFQKILYQKNSE